MVLTPEHEHLIESLVRDAYAAEHGEVSESLELSPEAVRSTELFQDLALVAHYAEGQAVALADVRKALYRVYGHIDPKRGFILSRVHDQQPLAPGTYTTSASTPFVLALSNMPVPRDWHETRLGQLVHAALYNMMEIGEVLTPSETAAVTDLGRQRVYELARDGHLFTIYKKTATGKGTLTSLYLAEQVDKIKQEIEARYNGRRRPGPQRGAHRAEKPKKVGGAKKPAASAATRKAR